MVKLTKSKQKFEQFLKEVSLEKIHKHQGYLSTFSGQQSYVCIRITSSRLGRKIKLLSPLFLQSKMLNLLPVITETIDHYWPVHLIFNHMQHTVQVQSKATHNHKGTQTAFPKWKWNAAKKMWLHFKQGSSLESLTMNAWMFFFLSLIHKPQNLFLLW